MKNRLVHITCALTGLFAGTLHANAGVIAELSEIIGPVAAPPATPIPIATVFVDNDESFTQINFTQAFQALNITATSPRVVFEFLAVDSGTGGTSEYLINQWIVNASGTPWTSLRYSLAARSTTGGALVVPGLDFDWPEQTALGAGSNNFSLIDHQPLMMTWGNGVANPGAHELTGFALDVPDIGADYVVVLTLEVPEPVSASCWSAGLLLLIRRRRP